MPPQDNPVFFATAVAVFALFEERLVSLNAMGHESVWSVRSSDVSFLFIAITANAIDWLVSLNAITAIVAITITAIVAICLFYSQRLQLFLLLAKTARIMLYNAITINGKARFIECN